MHEKTAVVAKSGSRQLRKMHVYISTEELVKPKLQPQSSSGGGKQCCHRSVLITGFLAYVFLLRAAFLALEVYGCVDWSSIGFGIGSDHPSPGILERIYLEDRFIDPAEITAAPESLDDLIAQMAALSSCDHFDIETFIFKTRAMLMKMDQKIQSSRIRALYYQHLASLGIPKTMHCLGLSLAEEYSFNAAARSPVPLPEYATRLTDDSYLHIALVTDNVLAAAVAVSSTVNSSSNPGKIVFHVITDKKTYAPMHAWFALHSVLPAVVEVKGLHQFDWPANVTDLVMTTVEEIRKSSAEYHHCGGIERECRRLQAFKPGTFSLLNCMKVHLPEFFPKLKRVLLLDDDVLVRKDLSELWEFDLGGNVMGATVCESEIEKTLGDLLNFSNPMMMSRSLDIHWAECAWSWGMNIFDLEAWRQTNITETYQFWLKTNRQSKFSLWKMSSLPPALIAFRGQVQAIEPLWHLSGLGSQMPDSDVLEASAVLHFSGPRKPWLEIGFPELREMWRGYLNSSDEFLRGCAVVE